MGEPASEATGDALHRVAATMLGADGACALPFALAVAAQLGGAPTRDAVAPSAGGRIALLLDAAARGGVAIEGAAATLAVDAEVLAAAYANLDLLPRGCAAGDRIAAAVSRALELLPILGG